MNKPSHRRRHTRAQRGVATLVVVMVLFFLLSMVAAYTSRNLIFEQRTSANQYRSTLALEAADAGVEWTLAHLNAGRLTDSCVPTADTTSPTTQRSFRQRYLNINPDTGAITFPTVSGGGSANPRCVFDGTSSSASDWGWSCSCPQTNAATTLVSTPAAPSFIILMSRTSPAIPSGRTDLFMVQSNSCTTLNSTCLSFSGTRGSTGEGVASVKAIVALRGALTRAPVAALTVAGTLAALPSGASLTVRNTDAATAAVTVHTGGAMPSPGTGITLAGAPGSLPASTSITGDTTLLPAAQGDFSSEDRRFVAYFGIRPATYNRQPGLVRIDCASGCSASAINTAMTLNPGRAIWLSGAGTVTIDTPVGSAAQPALLIVEGDVAFTGGSTVTGLIYGRKANWAWSVDTSGGVQGAVVAEGDLTFTGAAATTVTYDAAVLRTLRVSYGSFVRVPGSWQDFQ